jgi:hypothetical protein
MATKLTDDETYLKKYENLSRGEKQQVDLSKRMRLKEAQSESDAGDSIGQRVGDTVGRAMRDIAGSPSATREQAEVDTATANRKAERTRKLQEAKDSADYMQNSGMYSSSTPGKIKDNTFKTGGSVSASRRGDGIAQRGKTRGKMC